MLPRLEERRRCDELMDQPGLDPDLHRQALAGLRRINWFSRSAALLWPAIRQTAATSPGRSISVLDIACGGGDVLVALALRARRAGVPVEWHGCDISNLALDTAQRYAQQRGTTDICFFRHNVFSDAPLSARFDVVMCSLFLHHLDTSQAVELLRRMAKAAHRCVLVNDLQRTRWGYALAVVATRLLTRCPIVHFDGPASVTGAWKPSEVLALAASAGLTAVHVQRRWPARFLLRWNRP